jgi:lipopolysaccharide biosynthesis glycosyltransferase
VFGQSVVISIIQPLDEKSSMGLSSNSIKLIKVVFTKLNINYEIRQVDTSTFPEADLPIWANFTPTTWLRYYFLFNADMALEENVYYIDPDTIFINSTNTIFDIVPKNTFLYARTSPGHFVFEEKWKSIYKTSPWYFNCGVMIIDLSKWREELNQNDWWKTVLNWSDLNFTVIEQDALNYLIRGKKGELPLEFNCYPNELLSNPKTSIIHYAGHVKPWFYSNYFLRLKPNKSTRISITKWYAIRKSFLASIGSKNSKLIESPIVKFSTKLNIISPNLTNMLFKIKIYLRKLNSKMHKPFTNKLRS